MKNDVSRVIFDYTVAEWEESGVGLLAPRTVGVPEIVSLEAVSECFVKNLKVSSSLSSVVDRF